MNLHPWTLAPPLEDNSGLLSLMALGLALGIAVYQNWLAKRAEGRRRNDFVKLAAGLVGTMTCSAEECIQAIKSGQLDAAANKFAHDMKVATDSLEAIRPAAPPDAQLILTVTEVISTFNSMWTNLSIYGPDRAANMLTTLIGRLQQLQAEILSRRKS